MPLFDYICDCGNKEERLVDFNERDEQVCQCGKTLVRQIGVPAPAVWLTDCPTASKGRQYEN